MMDTITHIYIFKSTSLREARPALTGDWYNTGIFKSTSLREARPALTGDWYNTGIFKSTSLREARQKNCKKSNR